MFIIHFEAMRNAVGIPDLMMEKRDAWATSPIITLVMMDEYAVACAQRLRAKLGDNVTTRGNWGDAKRRNPERFFMKNSHAALAP
jgi:hypothetical protein